MIQAVFFDLDGTLLSPVSHTVPRSARDSLAALRARGIKTFLCTGRHAIELELLPSADIPFDAYITLNGHLCLDADKRMLFGIPFPETTVRALIASFQAERLPLMLVEENGHTLNFINDIVTRGRKNSAESIPGPVFYDGSPIYQAATFAPPEEDERIRALLPPDCRAARWNDHGVDLLLNEGGKTAGIRYVLEREGIPPEACIAFGDAENDIDMLEFCGIGVAMGNAQEKVKNIADYVTADADDSGVENALRFYGVI